MVRLAQWLGQERKQRPARCLARPAGFLSGGELLRGLVVDHGPGGVLLDRIDRSQRGCLRLVAFRSAHRLAVRRLEAEARFACLVGVNLEFVRHDFPQTSDGVDQSANQAPGDGTCQSGAAEACAQGNSEAPKTGTSVGAGG